MKNEMNTIWNFGFDFDFDWFNPPVAVLAV